MKLKCWKKISRSSKHISFATNNKVPNFDYISIYPTKLDVNGKPHAYKYERRFENKDFKSKSSALKFANRYMKEHDKC
jgi:hypothetical protein